MPSSKHSDEEFHKLQEELNQIKAAMEENQRKQEKLEDGKKLVEDLKKDAKKQALTLVYERDQSRKQANQLLKERDSIRTNNIILQ